MKSSQLIIHESMEIKYNILEIVLLSLSGFVISDMTAHCIWTHNSLYKPHVLVHKQANSKQVQADTVKILLSYIFFFFNGTTTLDRALASLTGFMIVRYVRCEVISPTINLVLATLIWPPGTSVSKASRHLVVKQVKRGWET
jgi:ABC-type antimicrobial peptide transport system permease subunit